MVWSLLIVLGEAAAAFLTLDLIFRSLDVSPDGLSRALRRAGGWYRSAAVIAVALGSWLAWRWAGEGWYAAPGLGWVPWWLLWRFGLRKQLTYLFKDDGGRPLDAQKPDP